MAEGLRVATIPVLMATMADMFPATFSTPKLVASWEPQYRATLSTLEGDELNSAWHFCMDGWTKKSAPSPADLLAAHRAPRRSNRGGNGDANSLTERLRKRDDERREDCRKLIERYEAEHAAGYEMARVEGWLGYLTEQVKRSANIIAQRNEKRRMGAPVSDWKPETCDVVLTAESSQSAIDKVEKFVPWISIVTVDGEDRIEIAQQTLKVWRTEAAIEGPAPKRPPSKSSTFNQVGAAA